MARIQRLPVAIAQQIAAGEVIERPVSIIKELIENALDAGATIIETTIKAGGKDYIEVRDNGHGMDDTDAALALLPHTTSKLREISDLNTLQTFGFRGEALASIAAVAHVTLKTRTPTSTHGYVVYTEHGTIHPPKACSCPVGTSITITQLFHTIPARLKFLKRDETEARLINQLISAYALAYPSIEWRLESDSVGNLHTVPTTTHTDRIASVFDTRIAKATLHGSAHREEYSVLLYTTSTQELRYDRNTIFIFLNNRWIKNIGITNALIRAYNNSLPPKRYPVASIFIECPTDSYDINIHPRKEEALFLHPGKIEALVQQAAENALGKQLESLLKTNNIPPATPSYNNFALHQSEPYLTTITHFENQSKNKWEEFDNKRATEAPWPNISSIEGKKTLSHSQKAETTVEQLALHSIPTKYHYLGLAYKTYIVALQEDNLLLIDQHAAHESVLFHALQKTLKIQSLPLIFPLRISLSSEEIDILTAHKEIIENAGFLFRIEEGITIITAIPADLRQENAQETWQNLINWIVEHPTAAAHELRRNLHATIACKAAIKAGDRLTAAEYQILLNQLASIPTGHQCPHGRPTFLQITEDYLKRAVRRSA